jgi:Acetyltransferase (GNAT) domain
VAAQLVHAALERVRAEPGGQLQLKTTSLLPEEAMAGLVRVPFRLTYALDLPEQPDALRLGTGQHRGAIKRAVHKAARSGVEVRPAETEQELRAWYRLYAETMRWHVVPPRPYHFFELVWRRLRPVGMARLLLAEQRTAGGTRLLAGSLFFQFGTTMHYAFNGRRFQDLALRPNDAIHWRAIHDACADGFRCYDFGEVGDDNPGLAAFKQKWGTRSDTLYRYYYPTPRDIEISLVEPSSRFHELMQPIWRRMPLGITIQVADWLHRHS